MERVADVGGRRWWALAAVILAVLAVGLDGTILSVALPTLAGSLHASENDLEWFSSGYLLVVAAGMLPAGLLADRYGRKKVLAGSLVLFGLGSVACALSRSPAVFIAARAVVGFGGAGIIVMAITALAGLFTDEERPKAIGIWAAANFLALPIGPILGGWMLTRLWWGWVFLMNVPVAAVALLAVLALVPESHPEKRPALDLPGIGGSVAGLVGVTYGLVQAGADGWSSARALVPIAIGIVILVAFGLWEVLVSRHDGEPLIDLALFRSRAFCWGVILAALGVLALYGAMFTLPQYFQAVRGADPMDSGLGLLPLIGGSLIGSIAANRMVEGLGAKVVVTAGFALLAAGLFLGSSIDLRSTRVFIGIWTALAGAGVGLIMATAAAAAVAQLSPTRAGVGSAVYQAVNKIAAPLGTAILGSIVNAGYVAGLDVRGLPGSATVAVKQSVFDGVEVARRLRSANLLEMVRAGFVQGMHSALLISGAIAALGLLLTLLFLPNVHKPRRME